MGVCDNILNFHRETMRFSCGGCVGQSLLVLPQDHEIFSWWSCGTAFFSFTRRPREFLMVDVHDNFLIFHNETTRFSRGGCVGKTLVVLPRDHKIFSWWMCGTTFFTVFQHPKMKSQVM